MVKEILGQCEFLLLPDFGAASILGPILYSGLYWSRLKEKEICAQTEIKMRIII